MTDRKSAKRLIRLGVSMATIFTIIFFLETAIFSPAGFKQTLEPLAQSQALRDSLGNQLDSVIQHSAPSVSRDVITRATTAVTSSSRFITTWIAQESSVHDQIIARISSGTDNSPLPLTIDITPLTTLLVQELHAAGIPVAIAVPMTDTVYTALTLPTSQVSGMRTMYAALGTAELVSAVLAILAIAAGLALSRRRIWAVAAVGRGMALQSAVFISILGIALIKVTELLGTPDEKGLLSLILYNGLSSHFVQLLETIGVAGVAVGLAAVIGAGIKFALTRSPQRAPDWSGEFAQILRTGAVLAAASVIFISGTPTPGRVAEVFGTLVGVVVFITIGTRLMDAVARRQPRQVVVDQPATMVS